jgi:hypothetical protein
MSYSTEAKTLALASGATCVGIADLAPFKQGWKVVPAELLAPFTRAISVAIRLDDATIDAIDGGPTVAYAEHYRAINAALDRVTGDLGKWITGKSFRADAIPASFVADGEELLGNISHKAVARMAGRGWGSPWARSIRWLTRSSSPSDATRLCGLRASWRMGQWEDLDSQSGRRRTDQGQGPDGAAVQPLAVLRHGATRCWPFRELAAQLAELCSRMRPNLANPCLQEQMGSSPLRSRSS